MKLLDRRLLRQVPQVRRLLQISALLSIAHGVAVVAQSVVIARLVVRVFVDRWTPIQCAELIQWLALVVVLRAALNWLAETVAARASARARSDLRRALLAAVAHGGPTVTRDLEPAGLAVLATKGIDSLDVYFTKVLPLVAVACVVPVTALLTIGINDRLSLGIIAATLPLVPFFMVLVGKETQVHASKQWQSMARLAGHLLDVVSGLVTLHIFGRARSQAAALRESGEDYRRRTMKVLRVSFLSTLVLELLSTLSIALVAVSIGLRLVEGKMALMAGLTVLLLAPEVYQPLRTLGAQFHAATDGLEAANQVIAIVDCADAVRDGDSDRDIPSDCTGISIQLEDVGVVYGSTEVLTNVSAKFESGNLYVVRGASGAGKTTLLNLLLAFLEPSTGRLSVCGREIDGVDGNWWRAQIAYLPQRPWLPRATVADALRMVAPSASDERIWEALHSAGIPVDDSSLPMGLQTQLFDSGIGVSVGQMRRIALARALLLRRPVLLLDEPTAGLDRAAATHVVRAARDAATQGAIVIVVVHSDAFDAVADDVMDLSAVLV